MHTLYKLKFSSGKCYIGQTTRTLKIRISQHRQSAVHGDSQLPVHCAWRKYGEPEIEVIGEHGSDEELHQAEILAITEHCSLAPSGYNVSFGGDTAPSKSPSVAAKISEKAKGRKHSEIVKAGLSDSLKERWKSEEYRSNVSAGLKATWDDERRKATSERMKAFWDKRKSEGWEMSEAHKGKLKGRKFSEETRRKMSESAIGKKKAQRSAETCGKISKNTSKSWKDPEVMARRSEAISKALKEKYASMTGEEKLTLSETRRRAWEKRRAKQTQPD
jgi:hypothetical protein